MCAKISLRVWFVTCTSTHSATDVNLWRIYMRCNPMCIRDELLRCARHRMAGLCVPIVVWRDLISVELALPGFPMRVHSCSGQLENNVRQTGCVGQNNTNIHCVWLGCRYINLGTG